MQMSPMTANGHRLCLFAKIHPLRLTYSGVSQACALAMTSTRPDTDPFSSSHDYAAAEYAKSLHRAHRAPRQSSQYRPRPFTLFGNTAARILRRNPGKNVVALSGWEVWLYANLAHPCSDRLSEGCPDELELMRWLDKGARGVNVYALSSLDLPIEVFLIKRL
ncbi:hypothetical protein FIBSPDRAFT_1050544 [Athelia psychrophila]|uniref:Uncharacterized protein n=1 Tax=Athelia psychrophila TaxID=1759441 RepID=A0A166ALH1_9AGAM|nr:hypothetical protein FIBSPDRAFT_1050544 [Fibularhizoctonia sp. CBS 109695]